jgi:hypothetical protein
MSSHWTTVVQKNSYFAESQVTGIFESNGKRKNWLSFTAFTVFGDHASRYLYYS